MQTHGLVIGKFYPFHKGHELLIRTAIEQSYRTTVVVYGTSDQKIPLNDRVDWIRETFKGARGLNVLPLLNDMFEDYVDENVWEAHDRILQAKIRQNDGLPVTAIFSSEDYGDTMMKYFPGAVSIVVDKARTAVPISGTMARADLHKHWGMLPAATRLGLIPRVIVLGAESTGTTTLSTALAEHYGARYVPEYGRQYTIDWLDSKKEAFPDATMEDLEWRPSDFERIGKFQTVLENRAALKVDGFPLVVGDTDAFATAVWAFRYRAGSWYSFREPYAQVPRRDLYLLTDHHGVDFEDDGYRDGESIRKEMTGWFEDALTEKGAPWALIRGTREERLANSIKLVDKVLERRLTFDT